MFFHLVYRRLPVAWFYRKTRRRKPLYDLDAAVRSFYFPETLGGKRK